VRRVLDVKASWPGRGDVKVTVAALSSPQSDGRGPRRPSGSQRWGGLLDVKASWLSRGDVLARPGVMSWLGRGWCQGHSSCTVVTAKRRPRSAMTVWIAALRRTRRRRSADDDDDAGTFRWTMA